MGRSRTPVATTPVLVELEGLDVDTRTWRVIDISDRLGDLRRQADRFLLGHFLCPYVGLRITSDNGIRVYERGLKA